MQRVAVSGAVLFKIVRVVKFHGAIDAEKILFSQIFRYFKKELFGLELVEIVFVKNVLKSRIVSLIDEPSFLRLERTNDSWWPKKVGFSRTGFNRDKIVTRFLRFSDKFYQRIF